MKQLILLRNLFIAFMTIGGAWIVLLIWLCSLTGCYGPRKATKQVVRAYVKQKPVVDNLFSIWYDPTDSVDRTTEYIQGDTLVFTDTVIVERNDTVFLTITKTVYEHDTVKTTIYKQLENKAGLQAKEAEIKTMREAHAKELKAKEKDLADRDKKVAVLQASNKSKNKWLWILGGIIGAYLVYKIARIYLKKQTGL